MKSCSYFPNLVLVWLPNKRKCSEVGERGHYSGVNLLNECLEIVISSNYFMKNIRCNCSSINIVLYIINIVINVFINVTQIRVSVCLFLSSIGFYNCHLVIIQIHSTGHQIIVYKYMKNHSKALILIVYTSLSWATLKTKFRY